MAAVFRCRHHLLDLDTNWRVNGSTVGPFPEIMEGTLNENDTKVFTLKIPADSKFNATTVVCVAAFLDGSMNQTPAATFFVMRGRLLLKITFN